MSKASKFMNNARQKAYQNRTQRVSNKEKKYNKTKRSKSDEAYIRGDFKSSVSKRAYGINKNIAEGKEVTGNYGDNFVNSGGQRRDRFLAQKQGKNPYEALYVTRPGASEYVPGGKRSDGSTYKGFMSKTRRLTDLEKEGYRRTGRLDHPDYQPKEKYIKWDERVSGGKFQDRLKTGRLDGLAIAKKNQRTGKPLQNAWEYIKGGAKDFIGDPLVDALKIGGYGASVATGIGAGLMEQSTNVMRGISSNGKQKYWEKGRIAKNVKDTIKELDETGWGKGFGDYLKESEERGYKNDLDYYKRTGNDYMVEQMTKNRDEQKKKVDMGANIAGFGMDIIQPTIISDKIGKGMGKVAKSLKNDAKNIIKGTSDVSTAFVPKEMRDLRGKYKQISKKAKGASDDVFFAGKKYESNLPLSKSDGKIIQDVKRMDNDYVRNVVKEPLVKTGRPALDRVLRGFDEVVPISNNSKVNKKLRYNPFKAKEREFDKIMSLQGDDIFKKIDNMNDVDTDMFFDYVKKKDPELYKALNYESDIIDDFVNKTQIETYKPKDFNAFNEVPSMPKINKKISVDELNPLNIVNKTRGINYNQALSSYKNFTKQLPIGFKTLSEESKFIEDVASKLGNKSISTVDKNKIIKQLNDRYFQGKDVISYNANPKDVKQFLGKLNEAVVKKSHDAIPDNLNKALSDLNMFRPSLVDPNFNNKLNKRSEIFKTNKTKLKQRLDEIVGKGKNITKEEMVERIEGEKKMKELDEWWNKYKNYTPEQWENEFPTHQKELKGYYDALEESATDRALKPSDIENYIDDLNNSYELDDFLTSKHPYNKFVEGALNEDPELLLDPNQKQILNNMYKDFIERQKQSEISRLVENNFGNNALQDFEGELVRNQKRNREIVEKTETQIANENARKYFEELKSARKTYGLKYVDWNKVPNIPKEKMNYATLIKHSDTKNALNNIKNIMYNEFKVKFSTNDAKQLSTLRDLKMENINALRKMGIDDKAYFNEMKNISLQMMDYLSGKVKKVEKYKSKSMDDIFKAKMQKKSNPLDNIGITINGKPILKDVQVDMSPDDLQYYYNKINGAKTIDELFDALPLNVAQHGDNTGKVIDNVVSNTDIEDFGKFIEEDLKKKYKELDKEFGVDEDGVVKNSFKSNKPSKSELDKMLEKLNDRYGKFESITDDDIAKGNFIDDVINPGELPRSEDIISEGRRYKPDIEVDNDGVVKESFKRDNSKFDEILSRINETYENPNKITDADIRNGNFPDNVINPGDLPRSEDIINENRRYKPKYEVDEDGVVKGSYSRDLDIDNKLKSLEETYGDKFADKVTDRDIAEGNFPDFFDHEGQFVPSRETVEKVIKEVDEETKQLAKEGIDATKQPPKKKPKNMAFDVYKRWLNTWKKGVTIYNPGWHVQNFFQNKGQNYLALGMDALKPQTNARQLLKAIERKPNNAKGVIRGNLKKAIKDGNVDNYSVDELSKLAQKLGVVDSLGEDVVNSKGIFGKYENAIDNSPFMKWLGKNEKHARLHHWLIQIENGMTPEEASKSVNKYLFDYAKPNTKFDSVMKNIDPFWTFHKNNSRMMAQSAFQHSAKLANIHKGTQGLSDGVPEEQQQAEGSMYRDAQAPHQSYTDSVNGGQYNYLYDQGMFPQLKNALPLEDEDNYFLNKLNPLIRLALQTANGEGNFGNKVVDKEEAGWNEITKEDRYKEVARDLNPILPTLINAIDENNKRKDKHDNEKLSKETLDKQVLNEWIKYITGHKGNWYRNLK